MKTLATVCLLLLSSQAQSANYNVTGNVRISTRFGGGFPAKGLNCFIKIYYLDANTLPQSTTMNCPITDNAGNYAGTWTPPASFSSISSAMFLNVTGYATLAPGIATTGCGGGIVGQNVSLTQSIVQP